MVVDNGSRALPALPAGARLLSPATNLGFAGGANHGARAAGGGALLFLNADACPAPDALAATLAGLAALPTADGLVPALVGADGVAQAAWQLRPLPRPGQLLAQAFGLDLVRGAEHPPEAGAAIEQPAAAALVLRRAAFERLGGFDDGFQPAWFEDVDLAARARAAGLVFRYWPAARFEHRLGGSLSALGYRAFLWFYYRNLARYLAKHHGRAWELALRALLPLAMAARLALLPLRRPRRAASRAGAARGLLAVAAGAVGGWRAPADLADAAPAALVRPIA